ncbi:hypothetical protein [Acinetobacter bereziniae]|uniref:hypothetical protein n=1 Tax=Acinetobacter bereziniae TaxID=106648 RepID=UPI0015DAE76F|nr:hypothetical protein [Acinetobacter bereziniae]
MEISKERKAFEEYLAGMKIHNLRVGTIFDTEKNEYFASDVLHPSEDHIVGWINFSWKLWQAKSTPEGFFLVPKVPSEEILPLNSLYEILDCQECCDAGGFCQERYIQIIEGISKAMIEAQEQK